MNSTCEFKIKTVKMAKVSGISLGFIAIFAVIAIAVLSSIGEAVVDVNCADPNNVNHTWCKYQVSEQDANPGSKFDPEY